MFDKLLALLRHAPHREPIEDLLWHATVDGTPLLRTLSPELQVQLRALTERFLADKHFYSGEEMELTLPMRVRVASLACLPVLHLGYEWLDAVHQVIIYPEVFVTHRKERDEFGLVHENDHVLSGEADDWGTLVFAWPEVEEAGQLHQGHNVVIHEVAHILDWRNGAFNGFPPLPHGMDARQWTADLSAAYEHLNQRLDSGAHAPINPYAATAPTEFFAVTSEYHFERPDLLRAAYPAVAKQLAQFYRGGSASDSVPDPA